MGRKVGSPVKEREINDYFVEAEENIFHALIPPKILWEDGETVRIIFIFWAFPRLRVVFSVH